MATVAPSPNDLTRQQLDELDALLQRMLSVPLAPPDTPMPVGAGRDAPPLPPSWRIDPPAPSAGASLPHIALPDPPSSAVSLKFEPPAPASEPTPAPAAPAPAPKPVAKTVPASPAPAPAAKVALAPAPVAVPAPKPVVAAALPAPVPVAPPVVLPLLPFVALNALFDAACGLFGPPGRVLRSGLFKHLYGLTGVGLIAYTLAHVAQTQGWVTLPVTLPWPR